MPLKRCGSVRARLRVWLCARRTARKAAGSASSTSSPPGRWTARPSSPRTTCSEARRFVPASVRTSVPSGKSNAASPILPGGLAPLRLPVQPAGDHQVQDEEQVAVELEDDALAEPAEAADDLALGGVQRRVEGADQERVDDAHPLQGLARRPGGAGTRCRRRRPGVRARGWLAGWGASSVHRGNRGATRSSLSRATAHSSMSYAVVGVPTGGPLTEWRYDGRRDSRHR